MCVLSKDDIRFSETLIFIIWILVRDLFLGRWKRMVFYSYFLFRQLAVTEIEAHNSNHRLEICPSRRSIIRCCIIIYLAVLSQQSVTVYLAPIIKANGERVSRRDERSKELRSKLGPANETFAPLSLWCQENKDPVVGASFNQLVSVCVCVCVC